MVPMAIHEQGYKDFADAGDEKGLTDRLQTFDAAMKDKEVLGKLALPELQRSPAGSSRKCDK